MTNEEYSKLIKDISPKSPIVKNCIWAFLVGGAICCLGQALMTLSNIWLDKDMAATEEREICACGIGVLFVEPYSRATLAELYQVMRDKVHNSGFSDYSELPGFFPEQN